MWRVLLLAAALLLGGCIDLRFDRYYSVERQVGRVGDANKLERSAVRWLKSQGFAYEPPGDSFSGDSWVRRGIHVRLYNDGLDLRYRVFTGFTDFGGLDESKRVAAELQAHLQSRTTSVPPRAPAGGFATPP